MITINLLPEEYRRTARTPLKLLLALGLAVAINGSLIAYLGWVTFAVARAVDSEQSTLQLDMDGLTPQVAYNKALEVEKGFYKSREETLGSITKSRVSWTRKIDELIDVVNRGGEGQRHLVWLDDLVTTENADPRLNSYGSVRASGHSGSEKFAQVANFLEDLEGSPFISDFHPPAPPEGTQSLIDEDLVPSIVWAFPLSLSLKGPEERQ